MQCLTSLLFSGSSPIEWICHEMAAREVEGD